MPPGPVRQRRAGGTRHVESHDPVPDPCRGPHRELRPARCRRGRELRAGASAQRHGRGLGRRRGGGRARRAAGRRFGGRCGGRDGLRARRDAPGRRQHRRRRVPRIPRGGRVGGRLRLPRDRPGRGVAGDVPERGRLRRRAPSRQPRGGRRAGNRRRAPSRLVRPRSPALAAARGAGGRAGPRRIRSLVRARRFAGWRSAPYGPLSGVDRGVLEPRATPPARRSSPPGGSGGHAGTHRRRRAGRFLPRADRGAHRARDGGARRADHGGRPGRLRGAGPRAGPGHLPRLRACSPCRPRAPAVSPSSRCSTCSRATTWRAAGHGSAINVHRIAEAMRRGFADRARHLGDPDFNPAMPVVRLTSKSYAEGLRAEHRTGAGLGVRPGRIRVAAGGPRDDPRVGCRCGAQRRLADHDPRAVLRLANRRAGRRIPAEQRDGRLQRRPRPHDGGRPHRHGEPNLAAPGKRMLSSMSPTIVARDGRPRDGDREPRRADHHQHRAAHHPQRDRLRHERAAGGRRAPLPPPVAAGPASSTSATASLPDTAALLEARGHRLAARARQGAAHAIVLDAESDVLAGRGGSAPGRRPGGRAIEVSRRAV